MTLQSAESAPVILTGSSAGVIYIEFREFIFLS